MKLRAVLGIIVTTLCLISCSKDKTLALLQNGASAECDSLSALLSRQGVNCEIVDIADAAGSDFSRFDAIWYHRSDSAHFSAKEIALGQSLESYLKKGGNLILSMEAVSLPNLWGYESEPVQLKYVDAVDEGFGRKLGYHAFREHPLFDGLYGGAYVWHGYEDNRNRVWGYFGDTLPKRPDSRIIGTLWEYIYYQPQAKVIWQQSIGEGKIFCIGAFLYYSRPNVHRSILEKFTSNLVNYAFGRKGVSKERYWTYSPVDVTFDDAEQSAKASGKTPYEWDFTKDADALEFEASRNEVVLAGSRVMLISEERGGIKEIWTHPVMSLKNLRVSAFKDGKEYMLDSPSSKVTLSGNSLLRPYGDIEEILTVAPKEPIALAHYQWQRGSVDSLVIDFSSNMRYMWPYDEDALGSLHCGIEAGCYVISDSDDEFCSAFAANLPWRLLSYGRDGDFVQASVRLSLDCSGSDACDLAFVCTGEGSKKTIKEAKQALRSPKDIYDVSQKHVEDYLADCVQIETPDKSFNEGYRWALRSLSTFLADTPGLGSGLMAGYASSLRGWGGGHRVSGRPGYAWYFGRDSELAAFAYLSAGDFDAVRSTITLLCDFQSENGQIFHELTTSGSVHYDASDSTPLLVLLVAAYWKATGDDEFVNSVMDNVRRAMTFCFTTDTDGDHLIEIEHVGHGWLEGGDYFTLRTEFYLSGIWLKALEDAAELEDEFGAELKAEEYRAEIPYVKASLEKFWNVQGQYYNYGKNPDGSYSSSLLALASVPVWLGVTEPDRAYSTVSKYSKDAFSTDWGVRQTSDPRSEEHAGAYDESNIWPLFTGSVSLAEYECGRFVQGFDHMMASLLCYEGDTHGRVPEVLRGNAYRSGGITRDQCWSETAVTGPAIRGMLGWKCDAPKKCLSLSPSFPFDWKEVRVDNLRSGKTLTGFTMTKSGEVVEYSFRSDSEGNTLDFSPVFPLGSEVMSVRLDGEDIPYTLLDMREYRSIKTTFPLPKGSSTLRIEVREGPSVLPSYRKAVPGGPSEGVRILSQQLDGDTLSVRVEGKKGSRAELNLYADGRKESVEVVFDKNTQKTVQTTTGGQ